MKQIIRRALRKCGLHCYTDRSLPTGVDWLADISRHRETDNPRTCCFDIGANIGQTVVALKEAFPGADVHAFEPFREPLQELRRVAGRYAAVRVMPLALGSSAATLQIRPRAQSVLNSLRSAPLANTGEGDPQLPCETITVTTVDDYCRKEGIGQIDILKTDTEGFDLEVLHGAADMLQRGLIRYVFTEVTFLEGNRQNTPFLPVFSLLQGHGFEFLGAYETWSMHHFASPNHFCNALFVHTGRV